MSTIQFFQIEKNDDDMRKEILTNITKMLTERHLLKEADLDENIKTVTSIQSDDLVYKIKIDDGTLVVVKIFTTKISSINKQSSVNDFLNKHVTHHKIIVTKGINENNITSIKANFPKVEIFLDNELETNLVDFVLVPRYEIIKQDSNEYKDFWNDYLLKKKQLQRLPVSDPAARYFNLKKGDLVRIIRPSEESVLSAGYRLVV